MGYLDLKKASKGVSKKDTTEDGVDAGGVTAKSSVPMDEIARDILEVVLTLKLCRRC